MVTSNIDGSCVQYPRGEGKRVRALFRAAGGEEGVIQAWHMKPLFPGRQELHTTLLPRALAEIGAKLCDD